MQLAHPKVAQPNWGPFGLESAIDFDHPSGTNARGPSQKAEKRWMIGTNGERESEKSMLAAQNDVDDDGGGDDDEVFTYLRWLWTLLIHCLLKYRYYD